MNVLYDFLSNRGVKLQDIIDFELGKIIQKNPKTKIHFMMYKTNDKMFNEFFFNVVEYNEDVKRIHDKSRGGVITLGDGRQYLIVGVTGTNFAVSSEHKKLFISLKERLLSQKIPYFNSEKGKQEEFWVSNDYTYVKDIQSGRRVRKTEGSEVKIRRISELLYNEEGDYNEESNPTHLGDPINKRSGYASLAWIIQKQNDYVPINTGSRQVERLVHPENNNGAVFLLIEAANNKLLPMYIRPTFYGEITNGKLKDRINSLLTELLSPDFERRKTAKESLKQFLVLSDNDTFTIGKEGFNTVSIKRNGSPFKTFNIDNGVNISEFLEAVRDSNFRINVTVSTLTSPGLVAEYDEAGALTTDISVLHTRNASYTIYTIDDKGEPIVTDTPNIMPSRQQSTERHIQYGNKRYRLDGNTYKDEVDKVVEDKELIKKLQYAQQIFNMTPSLQARGYSYYVIDDNIDNPVVIRQGQSNDIIIATKNQALGIINEINAIAEAKAKEAAAKAELERILQNAPEVYLGDLNGDTGAVSDTKPTTPEQSKQEPSTPQTPPSTTGKKNINNAGNISLENLDNTNNLTTFAELYTKSDFRNTLRAIFKEKGWTFGKKAEIEKLFEEKGISTVGITNLDSWLQMIKECK